MAEIMKRIVPVIVVDAEQPSFQCDGVYIKVLYQSQVMVHMLQTAQHLIRFPLPHIEDWLPQSFYCLLGEVILHKPTNTQAADAEDRKQKQERRRERRDSAVLDSYLVGFPQPDVEGGFSEGIYGLLGKHVLWV